MSRTKPSETLPTPADVPKAPAGPRVTFTPEEVAEIRAMDLPKRQEFLVEALMLGYDLPAAAELVGVSPAGARAWFRSDPDGMRALIRGAQAQVALMELPRNFSLLLELRDSSFNAETRRKAAADIARIAQVPIDALSAAAVNVNIRNGDGALVNLSFREINEKIAAVAKSLGPAAIELAREELGPRHARLLDAPGAARVLPDRPDPGEAAGGGARGAPAPAPGA